MTRTLALARPAALTVAALLLGSLALPTDPAHAAPRHNRSARADLQARSGGHAHFADHGHGHAATFFGTTPGHPAKRPADVSATATPAAAARGWMKHYGAVFGVADAARDLHVVASSRDAVGSIVRMQQTVDGLPVVGGGFSVALDSANNLVGVNGKATDLTAAASAVVTSGAARVLARRSVARQEPGTRLVVARPVLSVFDQSLYGVASITGPSTVWSTEVSSPDLTIRHRVFVDAVHGAIVLDLDENSHATQPTTHRVVCRPAKGADRRISNPRCKRPSTNSQVKVVAWESNPPPRSSKDAYNAFRFAGAVWTFYYKLLGRNSLDNHGMQLGSTVRYCPPSGMGSCPYDNAFWDGHEMVYGTGYTTALDVVGHEMTHGVTQHTSNLLSYYQSGAINESMSDTMGELIQQIEGPALHAYSSTQAWLLGEDLPIGAVRSMKNPTKFGDPDRMQSSNFSAYPAYSRNWDNGGVHANAGVGNKTAYLIAAGPHGDGTPGTFDGVALQGVAPAGTGRSATWQRDVKAANIYYRLDRTMWSATTYADVYDLLPAACDALVNQPLRMPGGVTPTTTTITTSDCDQVRLAVQATQLNLPPVKSGAQIPTAAVAACSNGGGPTQLRRDKFESNPFTAGTYTRGGSSSRDTYGLKAFGSFWWSNTYINYYGTKPEKYQLAGSKASLYGDDADPTWLDPNNNKYDRQDSWVQMKSGVLADSGTAIVFQHAWEFDYAPFDGKVQYYDAGKVYYSVDGGPWYDAGATSGPAGQRLLKSSGNGYNGQVAHVSGDLTNPLHGQQAFVGSSHGWTASKVDLSPLAGHRVKLRWRIGGDVAVGSLGWYIDDVFAYTCNATTTALAANPTSVTAASPTTTLTATVTRRGTSTPVDGATVTLWRRPDTSSSWQPVDSPAVTDSSGTVSWPDTVPGGAGTSELYQARVARDSGRGINPSTSPTATVTVTS